MGKLYVHSQFFVIYGSVKAKFFCLFHDVVTCDVHRDVSTAYTANLLQSSPPEED